MLVLGVTGDVGAGKSTVSGIFAKSGAVVINADLVAHKIWRRGNILSKAAERWGEDIIMSDGIIDSNKVASLVFRDDTEYRWLCGILHPLIREEMEREVSRLDGFVVVEIPLLFENGIPWWVDATMYVTAPYDIRLKRNSSRGWSKGDIARRERFLLPREEKISKSDITVFNDGDLGSIGEKLIDLASVMKNFASLSEFSFVVSSKDEAFEISSSALKDRLILEANVSETYILSCGGSDHAEKAWIVRFLAFQNHYRAILDFLVSYRILAGVLPAMKVFKRPGSIWKKYVSTEIRA